jgi:ankyrin repeat protein
MNQNKKNKNNKKNKKNKNNPTKRVKMIHDTINDNSTIMYKKMTDAIDGCSTLEELDLLLSHCPIDSLKMNHINNKYLLFIACQYIGYERFALRLYEVYPEAAIDQDGWNNYRNPLHIACSEGRLDIVIQLVINDINKFLNMPDSHGRTALFYASKNNNVTLARELLHEPSIDINIQDNNGQTALHLACLALSYGVIELLLNNPNINLNLIERSGNSICGSALRMFIWTVSTTDMNSLDNMHHILNMFLRLTPPEAISSCSNGNGFSILHEHADGAWPFFDAIDYLIHNGYGSLINQQDHLGKTPFHYLCQHSNWHVQFSATNHYMTSFLRLPNLLLNIKDNQGRTPLHEACLRGYSKMIKFLLVESDDYNVHLNVNLSDELGNTPLHYIIDGWFETTPDSDCLDTMMYLLSKNPFLIFHRNKRNENTLDYTKRRARERMMPENELVFYEFYDFLFYVINSYMQNARHHIYQYFLNNKSYLRPL